MTADARLSIHPSTSARLAVRIHTITQRCPLGTNRDEAGDNQPFNDSYGS